MNPGVGRGIALLLGVILLAGAAASSLRTSPGTRGGVALAHDTPPEDPLPSWRDGAAKRAILDFVARTTTPGSADLVPPAERIAVFDNDGTLWAEQPFYFQLAFAVDRVKALAPRHPEWKEKEPFASLLRDDLSAALAQGEHGIAAIVMATHAGMTPDEFDAVVKEWLAAAKHPKTGRAYTSMVYRPMLELLAHLRGAGYRTWIVSGGGTDFMRAFAERVYGIPPEQVIGSAGKLGFEMRDGKPVLVKLPELEFLDDKEGKPIAIQRIIGRRPVAAFGNSDGDLAMLRWIAAGAGPRFCLYVHHTDGEREWAYDRDSKIGRLDEGLEAARAAGWTVVDMKNDWERIFPAESAADR